MNWTTATIADQVQLRVQTAFCAADGAPLADAAGAAKPLALLFYIGFDCDGLVFSASVAADQSKEPSGQFHT